MTIAVEHSLTVICPKCHTIQVYSPQKVQKRRRKNCVSCQSKFTVNRSTIQLTPSLISTGTQLSRVRGEKKLKNPKLLTRRIVDSILALEGDEGERENLMAYLREIGFVIPDNPFFSKKDSKGVGGRGGGHSSKNRPTDEHSPNGAQAGHARHGHSSENGHAIGHDGHDILDQPQNFIPQSGEIESNESMYSSLRGIVTTPLNSGHERDPGSGKGPNINNNNDKNGIYVVHTPLEFIHLQFNDEVGRLHDHRLAKYENLSPRRFGIPQTLADELRPEMEKPHWKDPAQQYRKKIPGEFALILTKDNTCVLYPRHPFADQEFFKWAQTHLKKRHMKNLAYSYARAESQQTNEFYTPRIPSLIDEDPVNFTIKVNLDNPDQRFFVRRDQSKGDEIEYWGPTRQGGDWIYRYLSPAIEHAIGIQTYDKLKDFGGRFLNLDGYLRNQFPKVLQQLDQNGEVLHHITVKQRNQRILQDQFRDYFENSLAQGNQQLDFLSDIVRGQEIQTIELEKTLRETFSNYSQPLSKLSVEKVSIRKRTNIEQVILTFLRERPKETGYTRNELSDILDLPLGSISRHITDLREEGAILEEKEGRKAGRYLLNSTHLNNQMKNIKEDKNVN